ncbi:phosphatase PAP2 family protein [Actinoplanes sp. NPDC051859]|uniref:phosphatase PAP2 family protein n=1 Tax=Actinoplanes sp. NPDC051859 TaxID=3363909 RepID=UPI00378F5CBD
MKPGRRPTRAVAWAIGVLLSFGALGLLVGTRWAPLHESDTTITTAVHRWALTHPSWVEVTVWWTNVFAPFPLRFAVLLLVGWLLRRQDRRTALWAALTMVAGGLLGAGLKLLFGRDRPELLDPVARATGLSFPSGHALNATLAAGIFLLVLLPVVRRRWLLWTVAVVVAVGTGVSRVILGVHFTSDVIAGWLLGIAILAAVTPAFPRRQPTTTPDHEPMIRTPKPWREPRAGRR